VKIKHVILMLWLVFAANCYLISIAIYHALHDQDRAWMHVSFALYWLFWMWPIVGCLVDNHLTLIQKRRLKNELINLDKAILEHRENARAHHCEQIEAYLTEMMRENERLKRQLDQ
jgi:hypothetical protein